MSIADNFPISLCRIQILVCKITSDIHIQTYEESITYKKMTFKNILIKIIYIDCVSCRDQLKIDIKKVKKETKNMYASKQSDKH